MSEYIDSFTPDSVIAASVPLGGESPIEVAYNSAAYALDREDVHLLYAVEKETVYYIAAASSDFAGHISAVTPLSAALPGMKGHQGDGAYVAIAESGYAVVIKKDTDMFSYVGDRQAIDAFISSHNVQTFSVTENIAQPWEGHNLGILKRATNVARIAVLIGCILAVIAAAAWFFIASLGFDVEAEAAAIRRESDQSMQEAARQLNELGGHPLVDVLKKMQDLTTTAAEYGGYVTFYEFKDGKESWEVELPAWVTSEYIERLGRGVRPTKDTDRNLIIVRKGDSDKFTKDLR